MQQKTTFHYTGKIAACEFHVKRVSREVHVKFSHEIHVKFVSCEFHVKLSREFHVNCRWKEFHMKFTWKMHLYFTWILWEFQLQIKKNQIKKIAHLGIDISHKKNT